MAETDPACPIIFSLSLQSKRQAKAYRRHSAEIDDGSIPIGTEGDLMTKTNARPSANLWVRHTVATLAYRGGKALRRAPEGFSEFRAGEGSRAAGQILAHVCDLLDWVLSQARGK